MHHRRTSHTHDKQMPGMRAISTWPLAGTIECEACLGRGVYVGLFTHAPCASCYGSGITDIHGICLPTHKLITLLKARKDDREQEIRRLMDKPCVQKAIKAEQEQRLQAALGYGAGKYNGD